MSLDFSGFEILPTGIMLVDDLSAAIRGMERTCRVVEADRTDPSRYAGIRDLLPQLLSQWSLEVLKRATVLGAWCAINHPIQGYDARERYEILTRSGVGTHITIARGESRPERKGSAIYAMTIDSRFVDLQERLAAHREMRGLSKTVRVPRSF